MIKHVPNYQFATVSLSKQDSFFSPCFTNESSPCFTTFLEFPHLSLEEMNLEPSILEQANLAKQCRLVERVGRML